MNRDVALAQRLFWLVSAYSADEGYTAPGRSRPANRPMRAGATTYGSPTQPENLGSPGGRDMHDATRTALAAFLQAQAGSLLGVIRSYTLRMGLATGAGGYVDPHTVALDVLQEVVVEALSHADRFHPDGQPMAWLLGIAANVIRRRKASLALLKRREVSFGAYEVFPSANEALDMPDSVAGAPMEASQASFSPFDQPTQGYETAPEQALEVSEANRAAEALLALVSPKDQHILRLALLDDLSGQELAQALGVSVGAARMQLSRALGRLRAAWRAQQAQQQAAEGTAYE